MGNDSKKSYTWLKVIGVIAAVAAIAAAAYMVYVKFFLKKKKCCCNELEDTELVDSILESESATRAFEASAEDVIANPENLAE